MLIRRAPTKVPTIGKAENGGSSRSGVRQPGNRGIESYGIIARLAMSKKCIDTDMKARKIAPFPPDIRARIQASAPAAVPRPEGSGGKVAMPSRQASRTAGRKPDEELATPRVRTIIRQPNG